MTTSEILKELRIKNGLTQDEMAERFNVTCQDVSRWENGETAPDIETLKQISTACNISVSTLLCSPRKLYCQCCGMPMTGELHGTNAGGGRNEDYCNYCFKDGAFTFQGSMEEMIRLFSS